MSSPAPSGGGFRPIEKAAPVSRRERVASNNTRDMGLKVLYTIDEGNNTNCLARWPNVVSIQTAAIDERSVVGVVELKTCIQAVIQSSPEIISTAGRDYTVYAYDYSECDVPQSGQGMLSWSLAPDAPPQLVTGRVCKNTLGLFSKGVDETLEVKLRLVPVKTAQQNEYLINMETSRHPSTQYDHNEWNVLMKSQPGLSQMDHSFNAQTIPGNQVEVASRDDFSQLMDPIRTTMRASTPIKSTKRGKSNGSRPSSRNSVKRPPGRPRKNPAPVGNISGSEDVGTDGDDGPPRKRVRPSEAEYDGTSMFGDPESLRIRASTAASIRGDLRARLVAPGVGNGSQELPRAPTPVPNFPLQISTRDSALPQSNLRRESIHSTRDTYVSPYSDAPVDSGIGSERVHMSIECAMSSPECHDSPVHTPQDIGSSPPELSLRSSVAPPSSPVLPQMPRRDDSAYGGSGGLFGDEDEDDDLCPKDAEGDNQAISNRPGGSPAASVTSLDDHSLPRHRKHANSHSNSPFAQENVDQDSAAGTTAPSRNSPSISEAPVTMLSSIQLSHPVHVPRMGPVRASSFSTLPSATAGDMSIPPRNLPRSQTAGPQSTEDEIADSEPSLLDRNVAKKARIRSKLEQAIAEGKTPDFCSNCGAIETPTWRKAFTQDHKGDPGFIEYSDEPGRIMAVQILTRDAATGRSESYRIFKKSLLKTEFFKDFNPIMLCNPCGIWVSKYKSHRPQEQWSKSASNPNAGKRKPRARGKRRSEEDSQRNKKKQPGDNMYPTSEAYGQSEAYLPSEAHFQSEFQSEANFPQSEAPRATTSPGPPVGADNYGRHSASVDTQVQSRPSAFARMDISTTASNLVAINPAGRSSSDRVREGSRHSPIELEDGFGTTRRILFPSPRKDGSPKLLGAPQVNIVLSLPQPATNFTNPKEHLTHQKTDAFFDKENCPPINRSDESSISALFGEESPARPVTPTRSNPPSNPFKTPTRPTPNHRPITRSVSKSSSAKKSMSFDQSPSRTPARTPVRRSPRHNPDLVETPMTFMNRMFSQPDVQAALANVADFGDMDFSMPDMGMSFGDLGDNEGGYLRPNNDHAWNNIPYDIVGGHGDLDSSNEELARILELGLDAAAARNSNFHTFNDQRGVESNRNFDSEVKNHRERTNEQETHGDEDDVTQNDIKEEVISPMPTL